LDENLIGVNHTSHKLVMMNKKKQQSIEIPLSKYEHLLQMSSHMALKTILGQVDDVLEAVMIGDQPLEKCPFFEVMLAVNFLHQKYHESQKEHCPSQECPECHTERIIKKRVQKGDVTFVEGTQSKQ
jgi:hypothetical protein